MVLILQFHLANIVDIDEVGSSSLDIRVWFCFQDGYGY